MDKEEMVNLFEETTGYQRDEGKNEERETRVIKSLNQGKFILGDVANENVYDRVWSFFNEMYNKRKKKFGFFNFLYKSSFNEAYEEAEKLKNNCEKVKCLIQKSNKNNENSILSKINISALDKIEKFVVDGKKQMIQEEKKKLDDKKFMELVEEDYSKLTKLWFNIESCLDFGEILIGSCLQMLNKMKTDLKNGKIKEIFNSVENMLKNKKFGLEWKDECKKLREAEKPEDKKKLINELYDKYVTEKKQ